MLRNNGAAALRPAATRLTNRAWAARGWSEGRGAILGGAGVGSPRGWPSRDSADAALDGVTRLPVELGPEAVPAPERHGSKANRLSCAGAGYGRQDASGGGTGPTCEAEAADWLAARLR